MAKTELTPAAFAAVVAGGRRAGCGREPEPLLAGKRHRVLVRHERPQRLGHEGRDLARLYTADGALMPPGEARIDGRDAIQSYWKGAIDAGFKNITLKSVEVTASGDNAAEIDKWTIMGPTAKSEVQTMSGKYVVLWSHADGGSWQLYRDLWNDDPAGQN